MKFLVLPHPPPTSPPFPPCLSDPLYPLTPGSNAAFISSLTVLAVPIVAGLDGRTIPSSHWVSCLIGLAGVGLLESGPGEWQISDLLLVLSALTFSFHLYRTEKFTRALTADAARAGAGTAAGEDTALPLIAVQVAVTAVLSAVLAVGVDVHRGQGLHLPGSAEALAGYLLGLPWLAMAWTGVVSTAGCLWIECVAMREVPSQEAALIYTLEPMWGAMLAWIYLGER